MYVFQNSSLLDAVNRILTWLVPARAIPNTAWIKTGNSLRSGPRELLAASHTTSHTQGLFGRKTNSHYCHALNLIVVNARIIKVKIPCLPFKAMISHYPGMYHIKSRSETMEIRESLICEGGKNNQQVLFWSWCFKRKKIGYFDGHFVSFTGDFTNLT